MLNNLNFHNVQKVEIIKQGVIKKDNKIHEWLEIKLHGLSSDNYEDATFEIGIFTDTISVGDFINNLRDELNNLKIDITGNPPADTTPKNEILFRKFNLKPKTKFVPAAEISEDSLHPKDYIQKI